LPRKRKQEIKVNNNASLEGLMQETYNDACLQILDTQKIINELGVSAIGTDVDEHTKIAKEKGGLLKLKDSAIRIKLEVAKLQSDIIKSRGDIDEAVSVRSNGSASLDDFKSIREMLKKDNESKSEDE
jgi:hypothetical protein